MSDTLIVLVLAGIALLFKWLTGQASGDSKKPEPSSPNDGTPPPQNPSADGDTERIRRFLEALGAPPGTQPPPPVRPRAADRRRVVTPAPRNPPPQAKPSWTQPLPPLTTTPPEPVVFEVAPRPPVAAVPLPPPEPVTAPLQPVLLPGKAPPPRLMPVASLGAMLRSVRTARQAIMLREVLGPPRGLQALDDLRSF